MNGDQCKEEWEVGRKDGGRDEEANIWESMEGTRMDGWIWIWRRDGEMNEWINGDGGRKDSWMDACGWIEAGMEE